ncbi:hypothetical protein VaNZ11_003755 [Volvox africanus]|uniref:LysM domain-containing protein n=1 Tax=Volvox africanus TaxID=51714 RepID=A0ABQ5RWH2_9CHLO|nr:hypothetical protein VaNZ11_003755 [Volvox africanus]
MAYTSANIPVGLLDGVVASNVDEEEWSLGPFSLPIPFSQHNVTRPGSSSSSSSGGGGFKQLAVPDFRGTVRQFKEAVSAGLYPSSGRGGTASTSAPYAAGRREGSMQIQYSDNTPHLVGKRSIALRPRSTLPLSGWEPVYDDRDTRWWTIKDTALHGSYSWALQDYQSDREDVPVPGDAWRADIPSDVELAPVLTCRDLVKQVLVDQHGRGDTIQCAFPDQPCPSGTYKVMAFTSPIPEDDSAANYCDNHFYVQHKDVNIRLQPGDRLRDVAGFFKLPVDDLYDVNPGLADIPEDSPLDRERSVLVPDANVWSHKPSEWLPPRLHDGAGRAIHNPLRAVAAFSDDEGGMNELPAHYCCSFCVRPGLAKTGPQPRAPGAGQE